MKNGALATRQSWEVESSKVRQSILRQQDIHPARHSFSRQGSCYSHLSSCRLGNTDIITVLIIRIDSSDPKLLPCRRKLRTVIQIKSTFFYLFDKLFDLLHSRQTNAVGTVPSENAWKIAPSSKLGYELNEKDH